MAGAALGESMLSGVCVLSAAEAALSARGRGRASAWGVRGRE